MKENIILEKLYQDAGKLNIKTIPNDIQKDIDVMIKKMECNKSLISAIITSLIKKISSPKQDVRLHRVDFANGYSARVLDTRVTTPFFKNNFPKYANKENAFLTLATRKQIKWTKEDGQNLKIRDKELKNSFLNIFEQIEVKGTNPEQYLKYLLFRLIKLSKIDEAFLRIQSLES
ncbi:MAG: hypothetical protein LBN19_01600 [Endomicrobium sp.]|jgi:DNA (cytosine-5)-methyltransferase 1|nr:hypothetical protein [Endomicrobium sp.]